MFAETFLILRNAAENKSLLFNTEAVNVIPQGLNVTQIVVRGGSEAEERTIGTCNEGGDYG